MERKLKFDFSEMENKLDKLEELYLQDKLLDCIDILDSLGIDSSDSSPSLDPALTARLSSPLFTRLKSECDEVRVFRRGLENRDGWTMSYDGMETKVWYRPEPGTSSHSIMIEGYIRAPLLNVAALLRESDLFRHLFWYVIDSREIPLDAPTNLKSASYIESFAPWPLYNRDVAIYAFAVDALDYNGTVVIVSRSACKEDGIKDIPEPTSRVVRADINNSGFQLYPVSPQVTKATFLYNINPHLNVIPTVLINWGARTICRWSLRALEAHAKDLGALSEEYEQRLATMEVYNRIGMRLKSYWAVREASEPTVADEGVFESTRVSEQFNVNDAPEKAPSLITFLRSSPTDASSQSSTRSRWRLTRS